MQNGRHMMKEKIHAAKVWLDKAEQSYENESDAKGYLQLMVARAEMQHLSERTPFWMTKRGIFAIAIGLGAFLSLSLWGYGRYTESITPPPFTPVEIEQGTSPTVVGHSLSAPVETTPPKEAVVKATVAPVQEGSVEPVYTSVEVSSPVVAAPVSHPEPVVVEPIMSSREIQRAVQEGSRSLRE